MKKLLAFVLIVICLTAMITSCAKPKHNLTIKDVTEPTCTTMGYTEYGCEHCNEAYVDNFVSALGHTYGEGVAIIKEDCTTRGVYESTCIRCGEAHRYSVNANGHSYVEISSDGTTVAYECEVCLDVVNIASDDRIENYIGVIEIFDVEPNFSFQILSNGDESYIRENLKIIDAYFNGTEYENDAEVVQAYNLTNNGGGVWTVSAAAEYEYDITYLAKLTGELAFNNYKGNELSFTVMGDPNHVNGYAYKEGVLFLKTLEKTNGGYYPYEVRNASEGGIYLVVNKIDGLSKGQIICIGDVESLDDITSSTECYFGIIGDAYPLSNGQYAVMLAEPELQGIFDDLDIAFTGDVDLSGVKVDVDKLKNSVVDALYSNEDFVEFLSLVNVASYNYLEANGYYSPNLIDTETFLNSVDISPNVSFSGNSLATHLDGVITLDINGNGGEKIGTLKIEFAFDMESQFKIDVNYDIKAKWSGVKLERFDVAMTQNDTISFDFRVSVDSDKIGTSGYVINKNTGEAHLACCVEVTRASDASVFEKVSAEDAQGANVKCTRCKPENGASLENDFNGYYVNTLYCSDWERVASDIEKLTKMDKNSTRVNVGIGSVEIPICGPVGVNIGLNFALSFDVSAVMDYSYTYSQRNVYGMRLNHGYVQPYSQMTTGNMNQSDLSVLGTVEARVGLCVDSRVTISGFEKWINAGVSAEVGSYAELSGVLDTDKEYYGAYLEMGAYLDIDASYKLVNNSGSSDLAEIKRALAKYGYEKLYFAYETYYDSIKIEASYDIDANNLLAVKYYDLVNMVINTDELSLSGNGNYRVTLSLADGKYCEIKNGVIVYKAGAPEVFYDTLIITVTSNASWKNYRKGSALYYLGEYRVDFEFDTKHTHEWVEATCTTPKTCAYCGVKEGAALGHDWTDATCTVPKTCNRCKIKEGTTIPHTESGWIIDKEATETEEGSKHTECTVCGQWISTGKINTIVVSQGLEFTLNPDNQSYSVTGIGTCTDVDVVIPSTYNGLPVTDIGENAFQYRQFLTSIVIPNSVTSIGEWAFLSCKSLTSITIPDSVTSIGEWAFHNCTSLTNITIGNSVTSIGKWAFNGCTSLTNVTIGNSVTSIGDSAFYQCTSLTSITIPDSVTSIGERVFDNCRSLTNVTIGNSVTSIANYAFYYCTSLANVTIGNSVTSIGVAAFIECTSLTNVTIPDSVTSISGSAFRRCTSLTSIVIPNSVTTIESSAFSGCTSLTNVTIGNSVTSIDDYTFAECSSLTSIVIPNSVTSIGIHAFYGCTSLTSIVIPNSVTSISKSAFYKSTSLTIYCEATSKPSGWHIGWNDNNSPVVWGYKPE